MPPVSRKPALVFASSLVDVPHSGRLRMTAVSVNGAAQNGCSEYRVSIHGAALRAAPVSGDGYRSAAVAE